MAILPGMSTPRPSALVVGILSMLLVAAAAVPTVAAEPIPESTYRFTGYGTDHGVGFSQRGAAGRAAAGQTYGQILAHYFRGTRLGTVPRDTTIRTLVVKGYEAGTGQTTLVQGGKLSDTQKSRWTFDTPGVDGREFPQSWKLVLMGRGRSGAWDLEVQDASGDRRYAYSDEDARFTVRSIPTETVRGRLRLHIRPSTTYDTYEGTLRFGRVDGRIRVVNIVPIEPFVRSVTPQELGPANRQDTLKAQAVVARSYFLAGLSTGTSWLSYDVESYRDSQSYKGSKGENTTVTQAVDATAYEVVEYYKSADETWYIARTFYHAVGGGATEASQNVFTGTTGKPGSKTPYLKGGPDLCPEPDDPDGPQDAVPCDVGASAYFWSTRSFTLEPALGHPGQGQPDERGQALELAVRFRGKLSIRSDTPKLPGCLRAADLGRAEGRQERHGRGEESGRLALQERLQQPSRVGWPDRLDHDLPHQGRLTGCLWGGRGGGNHGAGSCPRWVSSDPNRRSSTRIRAGARSPEPGAWGTGFRGLEPGPGASPSSCWVTAAPPGRRNASITGWGHPSRLRFVARGQP